jgi:uncharacterized transporter YbjL
MEIARSIIGTQPILAIFLAIGIGYLVGQINFGGFSLGVGAVLFVQFRCLQRFRPLLRPGAGFTKLEKGA